MYVLLMSYPQKIIVLALVPSKGDPKKHVTRIMINKGMANKGKYWIFGKNKGVSLSNFEEPKGRNKGIQYWI